MPDTLSAFWRAVYVEAAKGWLTWYIDAVDPLGVTRGTEFNPRRVSVG